MSPVNSEVQADSATTQAVGRQRPATTGAGHGIGPSPRVQWPAQRLPASKPARGHGHKPLVRRRPHRNRSEPLSPSAPPQRKGMLREARHSRIIGPLTIPMPNANCHNRLHAIMACREAFRAPRYHSYLNPPSLPQRQTGGTHGDRSRFSVEPQPCGTEAIPFRYALNRPTHGALQKRYKKQGLSARSPRSVKPALWPNLTVHNRIRHVTVSGFCWGRASCKKE